MKFKYILTLIIVLIVNYHSNVLSWICFESNLVWIPLAIGFVILIRSIIKTIVDIAQYDINDEH
jgi:hypothetical protein